MPLPDNAQRSRERRHRGDDPEQIAEHLTNLHGTAEAQNVVARGIADAQRDGDNYRLSIWREIRRILRSRPPAPPEPEAVKK